MQQSAHFRQRSCPPALMTAVLGLAAAPALAQAATAQGKDTQAKDTAPNPFIVQEGTVKKLSEHVWEVPDRNRPGNPNVIIVVGSRATLIVDTGMGPKSGEAVAHEAQRLSKNTEFYLTTTDFRPEHISGAMGLPPNTKWIIPAAQKLDIDQSTQIYIDRFAARSADLMTALKDVKLREPDVLFDRDVKVDLGGGVSVALHWYGPARTNGDVLIFVEPDRLLHSGNILGSKTYPSMPAETPSVTNWLEIIDRLDALHPLIVVPNHGDVRDGSLIVGSREVLRALQQRAIELRALGKSAEEAGQMLIPEFEARYPDWKSLNNIPGIVARLYEQSQ
jgi:glyoxylase-like metal-dependent hydrolase (beta-lactamase superfamily II)